MLESLGARTGTWVDSDSVFGYIDTPSCVLWSFFKHFCTHQIPDACNSDITSCNLQCSPANRFPYAVGLAVLETCSKVTISSATADACLCSNRWHNNSWWRCDPEMPILEYRGVWKCVHSWFCFVQSSQHYKPCMNGLFQADTITCSQP